MGKSNVEAHVTLLGKTVKDKITGFEGIVSSVSFDLYGCIQAVVSPPLDKDGKLADGRWFDVNRLDVTKETRAMPIPEYSAPVSHRQGPSEKPSRDR